MACFWGFTSLVRIESIEFINVWFVENMLDFVGNVLDFVGFYWGILGDIEKLGNLFR